MCFKPGLKLQFVAKGQQSYTENKTGFLYETLKQFLFPPVIFVILAFNNKVPCWSRSLYVFITLEQLSAGQVAFVPLQLFYWSSLLTIKIYSCMFRADSGHLCFHVLYAAENVVQYLLCLLVFLCLPHSDEWEGKF